MSPRRMLLMLFAFAVALSAAAVTPVTPKYWKLLKKGTDGAAASREAEGGRRRAPWIEVATDRKQLDAIWREQVPGKPGDVDFANETVIFLLLGVQQTGGYAIEPISVEPPVKGIVRVNARLVQPMSDAMTTQALTAPYAAIAVRARGISWVEWHDADGRLLATRDVE